MVKSSTASGNSATRTEGVFEPDVLVQYLGHAGVQMTPERRLMLAVLEGALLVLREGADHEEWEETVAWFQDRSDWLFGFPEICAELQLSADAIATRLHRAGMLPSDQ